MRVAGFGFRAGAPMASLRSALELAGGASGISALATLAEKADAPAIRELARELGLPVRGVARDKLAVQATLTRSPRIVAGFGTGSVAEAAALAAAGGNARLVGPRMISGDGMASAAIARGDGHEGNEMGGQSA